MSQQLFHLEDGYMAILYTIFSTFGVYEVVHIKKSLKM